MSEPMLTCLIDDSEEQDDRVLAQTISDAVAVPGSDKGTRQELEICKKCYEIAKRAESSQFGFFPVC
jgi:hypothetical protein